MMGSEDRLFQMKRMPTKPGQKPLQLRQKLPSAPRPTQTWYAKGCTHRPQLPGLMACQIYGAGLSGCQKLQLKLLRPPP